jgi:acetolactate synthase-1/2/3 large subunit
MAKNRRGFLKGAAAGVAASAAALVTKPAVALAQDQPARRNGGATPNATTLARDTESAPAPDEEARRVENPGSDFMVEVLKSLKLEYWIDLQGVERAKFQI